MYQDLESNPLTEAEVEEVIAEFDHAGATSAEIDQDYLDAMAQDHDEDLSNMPSAEKTIVKTWKAENPNDTLKHQRRLLEEGIIDELPWENLNFQARVLGLTGLEADNVSNNNVGEVRGFGTNFPKQSAKGDMFLRVDQLPSVLYKFNGSAWIAVDKNLTDNYAYDDAYIDHLIDKISTGEYDPELLSETEREHIEQRLKYNLNKAADE
jgi:hypothetical protein